MERGRMTTRTTSGKTLLGHTLAVVSMLALFASIPVFAQVVGGSLSGTITDASGAALAGATVSLKNVATSVVTTVTTNAQGIFNAPNLLPGNYQATISSLGFQTSIQNDI